MTNWFADIGSSSLAMAMIWIFAALVLLAIVFAIFRLVRSMTFGTFVAGGRSRKTRLAVMDAAAVDSYRRLVLVRRDDIEHLLLIGGPTDVVIERDIRAANGRRVPSAFGDDSGAQLQDVSSAVQAQTAPRARTRGPDAAKSQNVVKPPTRTVPPHAISHSEHPVQPVTQPERNIPAQARAIRETGARPPMRESAVTTRLAPSRLPPATSSPEPSSTSYRGQPDNLDDDLMKELEVTFDTNVAKPPQQASSSVRAHPVEMTLDDEMTKLLGELSNNKR